MAVIRVHYAYYSSPRQIKLAGLNPGVSLPGPRSEGMVVMELIRFMQLAGIMSNRVSEIVEVVQMKGVQWR